jgi:hypothetical protein
MNSRPWYPLDIDVSTAIRSDFDYKEFYKNSKFNGQNVAIWWIDTNNLNNYFNKEWLSYIEGLNFKIKKLVFFYRKPYYIFPEAHVDTSRIKKVTANYAINWVISPNDDSDMVWYDVPLETGRANRPLSKTNISYLYWPMEEVKDKEISRCCLGATPHLINIGVAHNIIVREQERFAVSIQMEDSLSWSDAVNFYKKFIEE